LEKKRGAQKKKNLKGCSGSASWAAKKNLVTKARAKNGTSMTGKKCPNEGVQEKSEEKTERQGGKNRVDCQVKRGST